MSAKAPDFVFELIERRFKYAVARSKPPQNCPDRHPRFARHIVEGDVRDPPGRFDQPNTGTDDSTRVGIRLAGSEPLAVNPRRSSTGVFANELSRRHIGVM